MGLASAGFEKLTVGIGGTWGNFSSLIFIEVVTFPHCSRRSLAEDGRSLVPEAASQSSSSMASWIHDTSMAGTFDGGVHPEDPRDDEAVWRTKQPKQAAPTEGERRKKR